jgi:hypothetical protein
MTRGRRVYAGCFGDPSECCVVCGAKLPHEMSANVMFNEREEWKQLKALAPKNQRRLISVMVKTKDIESMYFHRHPWMLSHFYRAR